MENEVIIDGVNVAECNKYDGNSYIECLNDQTISRKCKSNPNCHFKQLQRLKAEIERLKEQINDAENYIDELQDALRDMEVQKDNNKYKTALEEIRDALNQPLVLSSNASMDFAIKKVIKYIDEVLE